MATAGTRPLRFAVIGAGMSGILCGIRLRERGHTDFTIYEKASSLGGTWRENTYPGIACDVPAHLYTYSFAPNPEFTHRFAEGHEIQAYFERVATEHGVDQHFRFDSEIRSCRFVDGRWHLDTADGHHDEVDVVLAATGVLHHPNLPEFEGLGDFEGAAFHSARWDHDVDLEGKRLGVIGTGSSAVQIVAATVDQVAELRLFQRTAQWIAPIDNDPYTEEERQRFRDHPEELQVLYKELRALFTEGFSDAVVDADSPHLAGIAQRCAEHLDTVRDPELREALRPDYQAACKRLVVSADFYEAIQEPHARLVTAGIERFEPKGIRTVDGELHELDVVAICTGFRVDRFLRPIHVVGRDGVDLDDVWAERPIAYLSISVPGFPNLFMLNGPNGPVGNFSLIEIAEKQLHYIFQLIDRIEAGQCGEVSATGEATVAFDEERVEAAKRTVWYTGCNSWYLDDRGIPAVWPFKMERFTNEMAEPKLGAYELR
ncbi:MAG: NAD(P)/FAD-dependent oxidoreductase [Acidimicrobiia bacterium]|nr:NAD(P)/FAD-dependent oxidoreductase [Acidimicrobiia bacterium]